MRKGKHWAFSYLVLFVVTLIFSYCLFVFRGPTSEEGEMPNLFFAISFLVMIWIPGVVGIVFSRKENIRFPIFSKPNRFFFLAPLVVMVIVGVAILCSLPFDTLLDPIPFFKEGSAHPKVIPLLGILLGGYIGGLSVNMIAALGEEIYWRGYLWEKLKNKGALKAIGITGLLSGIWHLPIVIFVGYNYPGRPIFGSLVMVLLALALSVPITYYRLKGKSVMTAAAFHGSFNAIAPLSLIVFSDPNPTFLGATGLIGIGVIALYSLVFGLFSSARWKNLV
ncbi:MAG: hypothetical protein KR126chlam1_00774 [Chlamydiae bacterium]|nr:hypothetical protein [Chlamydiota bacterium]